jgi:hypothetical protein
LLQTELGELTDGLFTEDVVEVGLSLMISISPSKLSRFKLVELEFRLFICVLNVSLVATIKVKIRTKINKIYIHAT